MKAFCLKGGNGPGLSRRVCFILVKRLLSRIEGRSHDAEDRRRILRSIALHRGSVQGARGFCLVVNDDGCLERATGPAWDRLLEELGVCSSATMPPQFDPSAYCTGDSLHKIASPVPGDGGEVRHVMLESRQGRFEALLEEVTNVEGLRAAVVTMTSETKGPMTCVLAEFAKEGVVAGVLESLFPSAEVIRVSDDSRRLVFTHLGSSCRWMFETENDIVLVPVLDRQRLEENKALVTFRGDDDTLETVLFSWTPSDESGLGSFVKLSINTPVRPLLAVPSAEALEGRSICMSVWLAKDVRAMNEGSRVYVISEQAPLFAKVLSRIVDAAESSGQGALSYARWEDKVTGAAVYAFRSEPIGELDAYRDVLSYRIIDSQLNPYGLAVRQGYRFVPEMPDDDDWALALKHALFDSVGAVGAAWALVDPCDLNDEGLAGMTAVIVPEFMPFEGYRKHLSVFGPVVRAELIAEDKERHREFSARAEQAWHQSAEAERAHRDAYAQSLFLGMEKEAEVLDRSLGAMRDDVQSTKDMAAPLFAEAKLARDTLEQTTRSFKVAVNAAADKSANWAMLQRQLQENVALLESYARMLDDTVRSHAQAELGRIRAQDLALAGRLAELKLAEQEVISAHENSALLVARLEGETAHVHSEIERLSRAVAQDAQRVSEFDKLAEKMRSLADLEMAKESEALKLRMASAQCQAKEAEVKDELRRLEKSRSELADKLRDFANQTSEADRRREAVRLAGIDVRNAEAERDKHLRALRQEEEALARMIKDGDPRVAARELLDKTKSIRDQIAEVEEAGRLLADGDVEIRKQQERLDQLLDGGSLEGVRTMVMGSEEALFALERAIASLETALEADEVLRRNPLAAERLVAWTRFKTEATRRLRSARACYLRSQNPLDPPLPDEINAAIESLRQLL